ncbi:protein of unknown function DUF29 [Xenococcus sp. PCC 7305]|uniref:DUF29 domain-containing protein n=1 Tax=Xenococcus sp. PCC 7305 TaxID=102125 RepID=UPI0002AC0C9C|nr:DUF29 domain-containing protein [Xenococcus sp. PCC 7305]ELS02677.1 protein of unknown function DUF29 [Xenococcus sp. PCC 7305]
MTAKVPSAKSIDKLYDEDYYLWLKNTAQLIREKRFAEVDAVNLVEEIEDMGRSEKRALESNLVVLILHLLKYKYQPAKRSNSWKASIREHRRRLRKAFEDSPSLKGYCEKVFAECYEDARKQASDETELSLDIFPVASPFTVSQVLDEEYLID